MKSSAITGLVAAAALTACATGPKLDYREYAGEPVKSFYLSNLDGWHAVSKDQIVVWAGINDAYLLNLAGYCPELPFATTIGLTSTAHYVDKFEKVLVGRDRCFIREIRPIDTKQLKADRKLVREQMKKGSVEDKPAEEKQAGST